MNSVSTFKLFFKEKYIWFKWLFLYFKDPLQKIKDPVFDLNKIFVLQIPFS